MHHLKVSGNAIGDIVYLSVSYTAYPKHVLKKLLNHHKKRLVYRVLRTSVKFK